MPLRLLFEDTPPGVAVVTTPRAPYPECQVPFTLPVVGVRTWQSSAGDGGFVYPGCSGETDCACACSVRVYKVNGRIFGCGCHGHDAHRARLAGKQ